jgi:hypothetical protein
MDMTVVMDEKRKWNFLVPASIADAFDTVARSGRHGDKSVMAASAAAILLVIPDDLRMEIMHQMRMAETASKRVGDDTQVLEEFRRRATPVLAKAFTPPNEDTERHPGDLGPTPGAGGGGPSGGGGGLVGPGTQRGLEVLEKDAEQRRAAKANRKRRAS